MTAALVALALTTLAATTIRGLAAIHNHHCPCTWANDTETP